MQRATYTKVDAECDKPTTVVSLSYGASTQVDNTCDSHRADAKFLKSEFGEKF